MWPDSSEVRVLARSARGPGFESPSGRVLFSSPVTFGGSVWVRARAASRKGTVSSVPAWFRADSGTNLIKQGEIVTGRPCGPIAQWSEYSHGLREVLGSSPGRAMCFFLPCDNSGPERQKCLCNRGQHIESDGYHSSVFLRKRQ